MDAAPLGLPLQGVHDACPACGQRAWLVYVWYRRCAACRHRDETTTTHVPTRDPRKARTTRTRDDAPVWL